MLDGSKSREKAFSGNTVILHFVLRLENMCKVMESVRERVNQTS